MSLLRPILTAALLTIATLPASAGDAAARRVIGFSPDGNTFAFEQYTTLYDSLEHMVEIQMIDTRTDSFVKGTPFRLRADEDKKGHDLGEARNELMRKARPVVIGNLKVSEPGQHFPGKPSMELDEIGIYQMDPKPLATSQDFTLPDGRKASLNISETALGKASCYGAGGRGTYGDVITQGVTLTLSLDGGAPVTLQADKPAAEKPPLRHRLRHCGGMAAPRTGWHADAGGAAGNRRCPRIPRRAEPALHGGHPQAGGAESPVIALLFPVC